MKKIILAAAAAVLTTMLMAPTTSGFHGSWWRAHELPGTSAIMGLDHDAHPVSTATNLVTGEVYAADVQWSGEQFVAAKFNGFITIKIIDGAGEIVHQATLPAIEDISNVLWIQCPAASNDPGINLETLPTYSMNIPGILALGPGAPGGAGKMRNSFCGNFNDPASPTYFKDFSDYEGTYLPTVNGLTGAYRLHLHVRGADHG